MLRTLLIILALNMSLAQADAFRFHMLAEPHTLDPQSTAANSGNYIFQNIYRGLYRYHSQRGLILGGAKKCTRAHLRLTCLLNPNHHWSNGEPIVAGDYVRTFRRLIDPSKRSTQAELILSLKNARAIVRGEQKSEALGVLAVSDTVVRFDFDEEDAEFEFKLTNTAMAPWPVSGLREREAGAEMVTSGPYQIKEWRLGHWIKLVANPHFGLPASAHLPDVEAVVVEDDSTALRLYEAGKLNFLRRLTTFEVPRFKKSPELKQIQAARFDYIGFGPELLSQPALREALTKGVEYPEFLKMVGTISTPGCPSLPSRLLDRQPCYKFAPDQAKKLATAKAMDRKLEMYFSALGGEDISRISEWYQAQWKKSLGLTIELHPQEQIVYLSHLRKSPPALFRKGVSLDRPTCLAAAEIFTKGHPENYIQFNEPEYDRLVHHLSLQTTVAARKIACRRALEFLMNSHRLIPQGEYYFSILAKPTFQGWDLNELNQLDLTDLTEVGSKSSPTSGL